MPNSKLVPFRLSPNEEARIIKQERERRRKERIIQVREQSKVNALKIREAVKNEKQKQLQLVAENLLQEYEKEKQEKLSKLQEDYNKTLQTVGKAHQSADDWDPKTEERYIVWQEDNKRAEARNRVAIAKMKVEKEEKENEQTKHIVARKHAIEKERLRAARVAAMPPPPPDPLANLEQSKVKKSVQLTDLDAFSSTHYHLHGDVAVERAEAEEQGDARADAVDEEERIQYRQEEDLRVNTEHVEKARLRHKHALKKVILKQDYENILHDLSDLQREDVHRRQQLVANIPRQIFQPPHRRVEQREDKQRQLEERFEDMYMQATDFIGDMSLALDPHPVPATPSSEASLDLTLDASQNDHSQLEQTDKSPVDVIIEQPVAAAPGVQHVDPIKIPQAKVEETGPDLQKKKPDAVLKKLLTKIKSQRDDWLTSSTDQIPEVEQKQQAKPDIVKQRVDEVIVKDRQPANDTTPQISKEKSLEVQGSEISDTVSADSISQYPISQKTSSTVSHQADSTVSPKEGSMESQQSGSTVSEYPISEQAVTAVSDGRTNTTERLIETVRKSQDPFSLRQPYDDAIEVIESLQRQQQELEEHQRDRKTTEELATAGIDQQLIRQTMREPHPILGKTESEQNIAITDQITNEYKAHESPNNKSPAHESPHSEPQRTDIIDFSKLNEQNEQFEKIKSHQREILERHRIIEERELKRKEEERKLIESESTAKQEIDDIRKYQQLILDQHARIQSQKDQIEKQGLGVQKEFKSQFFQDLQQHQNQSLQQEVQQQQERQQWSPLSEDSSLQMTPLTPELQPVTPKSKTRSPLSEHSPYDPKRYDVEHHYDNQGLEEDRAQHGSYNIQAPFEIYEDQTTEQTQQQQGNTEHVTLGYPQQLDTVETPERHSDQQLLKTRPFDESHRAITKENIVVADKQFPKFGSSSFADWGKEMERYRQSTTLAPNQPAPGLQYEHPKSHTPQFKPGAPNSVTFASPINQISFNSETTSPSSQYISHIQRDSDSQLEDPRLGHLGLQSGDPRSSFVGEPMRSFEGLSQEEVARIQRLQQHQMKLIQKHKESDENLRLIQNMIQQKKLQLQQTYGPTTTKEPPVQQGYSTQTDDVINKDEVSIPQNDDITTRALYQRLESERRQKEMRQQLDRLRIEKQQILEKINGTPEPPKHAPPPTRKAPLDNVQFHELSTIQEVETPKPAQRFTLPPFDTSSSVSPGSSTGNSYASPSDRHPSFNILDSVGANFRKQVQFECMDQAPIVLATDTSSGGTPDNGRAVDIDRGATPESGRATADSGFYTKTLPELQQALEREMNKKSPTGQGLYSESDYQRQLSQQRPSIPQATLKPPPSMQPFPSEQTLHQASVTGAPYIGDVSTGYPPSQYVNTSQLSQSDTHSLRQGIEQTFQDSATQPSQHWTLPEPTRGTHLSTSGGSSTESPLLTDPDELVAKYLAQAQQKRQLDPHSGVPEGGMMFHGRADGGISTLGRARGEGVGAPSNGANTSTHFSDIAGSLEDGFHPDTGGISLQSTAEKQKPGRLFTLDHTQSTLGDELSQYPLDETATSMQSQKQPLHSRYQQGTVILPGRQRSPREHQDAERLRHVYRPLDETQETHTSILSDQHTMSSIDSPNTIVQKYLSQATAQQQAMSQQGKSQQQGLSQQGMTQGMPQQGMTQQQDMLQAQNRIFADQRQRMNIGEQPESSYQQLPSDISSLSSYVDRSLGRHQDVSQQGQSPQSMSQQGQSPQSMSQQGMPQQYLSQAIPQKGMLQQSIPQQGMPQQGHKQHSFGSTLDDISQGQIHSNLGSPGSNVISSGDDVRLSQYGAYSGARAPDDSTGDPIQQSIELTPKVSDLLMTGLSKVQTEATDQLNLYSKMPQQSTHLSSLSPETSQYQPSSHLTSHFPESSKNRDAMSLPPIGEARDDVHISLYSGHTDTTYMSLPPTRTQYHSGNMGQPQVLPQAAERDTPQRLGGVGRDNMDGRTTDQSTLKGHSISQYPNIDSSFVSSYSGSLSQYPVTEISTDVENTMRQTTQGRYQPREFFNDRHQRTMLSELSTITGARLSDVNVTNDEFQPLQTRSKSSTPSKQPGSDRFAPLPEVSSTSTPSSKNTSDIEQFRIESQSNISLAFSESTIHSDDSQSDAGSLHNYRGECKSSTPLADKSKWLPLEPDTQMTCDTHVTSDTSRSTTLGGSSLEVTREATGISEEPDLTFVTVTSIDDHLSVMEDYDEEADTTITDQPNTPVMNQPNTPVMDQPNSPVMGQSNTPVMGQTNTPTMGQQSHVDANTPMIDPTTKNRQNDISLSVNENLGNISKTTENLSLMSFEQHELSSMEVSVTLNNSEKPSNSEQTSIWNTQTQDSTDVDKYHNQKEFSSGEISIPQDNGEKPGRIEQTSVWESHESKGVRENSGEISITQNNTDNLRKSCDSTNARENTKDNDSTEHSNGSRTLKLNPIVDIKIDDNTQPRDNDTDVQPGNTANAPRNVFHAGQGKDKRPGLSARINEMRDSDNRRKLQEVIVTVPPATWDSGSEENLPVLGQPKSKVDSVKMSSAITTGTIRKKAAKEMYKRTERLYNQLEDVKEKKQVQERAKQYKENREKAKQFHNKVQKALKRKSVERKDGQSSKP